MDPFSSAERSGFGVNVRGEAKDWPRKLPSRVDPSETQTPTWRKGNRDCPRPRWGSLPYRGLVQKGI